MAASAVISEFRQTAFAKHSSASQLSQQEEVPVISDADAATLPQVVVAGQRKAGVLLIGWHQWRTVQPFSSQDCCESSQYWREKASNHHPGILPLSLRWGKFKSRKRADPKSSRAPARGAWRRALGSRRGGVTWGEAGQPRALPRTPTQLERHQPGPPALRPAGWEMIQRTVAFRRATQLIS